MTTTATNKTKNKQKQTKNKTKQTNKKEKKNNKANQNRIFIEFWAKILKFTLLPAKKKIVKSKGFFYESDVIKPIL